MTHSIEELKRQMDAAKSRYNEASGKLDDAREAYHQALARAGEAEFAAKGITPGTKVVARRASGEIYAEAIYVGHNTRLGAAFPVCKKITKSGKPHGIQRVTARSITDWEPAQ